MASAKLRYQRVIDLVERLIVERNLRPGDLLPSRNELAAMAGVSMITVRRALDELERDGRVAAHQGVGTFVAGSRIVSEPARVGGLLATLEQEGKLLQVRTELLDIVESLPNAHVARVLHIQPEDHVWQVVRLRLIEGKPMILEEALIPVALAPGLGERREELLGSLYEFLGRAYGLVDDYEEQFLEVTLPSQYARRYLRVGAKEHVVRVRGVSFSPQAVPFDCFQQVYPAGGFVFCVSGQTDRHLVRAADLSDWGATPLGRRVSLKQGEGGSSMGNRQEQRKGEESYG